MNFELNWSDGYNGTLQILPPGGGQPEITIEGVDDAAFAPDDTFAILRSLDGEQRLEYPAGTVLYKSTGWIPIRDSHQRATRLPSSNILWVTSVAS